MPYTIVTLTADMNRFAGAAVGDAAALMIHPSANAVALPPSLAKALQDADELAAQIAEKCRFSLFKPRE